MVLANLKEAMIRFLKNQNKHFEMDDIIFRDNVHDNCIIVVMFLAIYKLFRYVDYYGKVDIFTRTLANVRLPIAEPGISFAQATGGFKG